MKSRQIALCGVLSALALCFLLLGSVIPAATFCGPILSMALLLPVQEECGARLAGACWAAVSLLGLLLAADREAALIYHFFGWCSILRPRLDKLPSRLLRQVLLLAVCNGLAGLLCVLTVKVLGLPTGLEGESSWFLLLLLVLLNAVFLLADRALDRLTVLWRRRVRRRFFR